MRDTKEQEDCVAIRRVCSSVVKEASVFWDQ